MNLRKDFFFYFYIILQITKYDLLYGFIDFLYDEVLNYLVFIFVFNRYYLFDEFKHISNREKKIIEDVISKCD